MLKPKIAYQLYSARDEAAKDLRAVLATLKQQGYDGVEFAGFYGYSAEDIKQMLADVGLQPASSHVPLKLIRANQEEILAYHLELGCPHLVVPYLEEEDRPGMPGFAGVISSMGAAAIWSRSPTITSCSGPCPPAAADCSASVAGRKVR